MHFNRKSLSKKKMLRLTIGSKTLSQFNKFKRDAKGVSVVISNLILIVAVIVVGFSVLAYANSQSNDYKTEYSQSVNSNINRIKETVAFEFAFYNSSEYSPTNGSLTVYFMNAGNIGNVTISYVTISNSSISWNWNWTNKPIYYLDKNVAEAIDVDQEGYIKVALAQVDNHWLVPGKSYTVKLNTWRGSNFEYTFDA